MSSAGHVLDMIKRMSQNRSLRASNRNKFKENNRTYIYNGTNKKDKATFKKVSKEQVKLVVNQINQKFKTKRQKELLILIFCFGIIGFLTIYGIISSTNYLKNEPSNRNATEYKWRQPRTWSGKQSDPLKVPFSNFFYSPIIGRLDFEVQVDKNYTLYNDDMVVNNTTNLLFFDSECNLITKLLQKKGYIKWMHVGPSKKDLFPKKIIYSLAEKDTNNDGLVNNKDHHNVYISDLNGEKLSKITDRSVQTIKWIGKGEEMFIEFGSTDTKKESLFGVFNTETKKLRGTNQRIEE